MNLRKEVMKILEANLLQSTLSPLVGRHQAIIFDLSRLLDRVKNLPLPSEDYLRKLKESNPETCEALVSNWSGELSNIEKSIELLIDTMKFYK